MKAHVILTSHTCIVLRIVTVGGVGSDDCHCARSLARKTKQATRDVQRGQIMLGDGGGGGAGQTFKEFDLPFIVV